MSKKYYITLSTLLAIALTGCGFSSTTSNEPISLPSVNESVSEITSEDAPSLPEDVSSVEESISMEQSVSLSVEEPSISEEDDGVNENFDFAAAGYGVAHVEEKSELKSYSPTTFNSTNYSETKTTLQDGVDLYVSSYKTNSNHNVSPNYVVVDLNKADIVAGSYEDTTSSYSTKSTPYAMAVAWEANHSTQKVLAATNADFFGSNSVNAFVKDGVIIKSQHNQDLNDVPVSKPMLFGVSSAGAQIAPMTNYSNYNDNLAASLTSTGVAFMSAEGNYIGTYQFKSESGLVTNAIGIISTSTTKKSVPTGAKIYKFKKIQKSQCTENEVRGCIIEEITGTSVKNEDPTNYGYVVVGSTFTSVELSVGDYFAATDNTVMSPDGLWNNYTTILGCRHSLVENGEIPSTVAKETSNGAQSCVPRTAVGVTSDGKVVIVSVEDLHYGGKASSCTGLSLTELADFMRYIGCYDAANFDGGGSSQLITKTTTSYVVRTKSSDTGSSTPISTRSVYNGILVVTK